MSWTPKKCARAESTQNKIANGALSLAKARQIARLTKEGRVPSGGTPPGEPQFPRTDAYHGEIEQLTEYVAVSEKGKTTLETEKGVSHARAIDRSSLTS